MFEIKTKNGDEVLVSGTCPNDALIKAIWQHVDLSRADLSGICRSHVLPAVQEMILDQYHWSFTLWSAEACPNCKCKFCVAEISDRISQTEYRRVMSLTPDEQREYNEKIRASLEAEGLL